MAETYKRCVRCKGQKELYKVGGAYLNVDIGGLKVKCPCCNGKGMMEILSIPESKNDKTVKKSRGRPKKDSTSTKDKVEVAVNIAATDANLPAEDLRASVGAE